MTFHVSIKLIAVSFSGFQESTSRDLKLETSSFFESPSRSTVWGAAAGMTSSPWSLWWPEQKPPGSLPRFRMCCSYTPAVMLWCSSHPITPRTGVITHFVCWVQTGSQEGSWARQRCSQNSAADNRSVTDPLQPLHSWTCTTWIFWTISEFLHRFVGVDISDPANCACL